MGSYKILLLEGSFHKGGRSGQTGFLIFVFRRLCLSSAYLINASGSVSGYFQRMLRIILEQFPKISDLANFFQNSLILPAYESLFLTQPSIHYNILQFQW